MKVKLFKYQPRLSFDICTSGTFFKYSCISQLLPLYFFQYMMKVELKSSTLSLGRFLCGETPERLQVFVSIRITNC